MQAVSLTPDKVLNSLIYGLPFCVIIYTSYNYKLSKWSDFSWIKLIGIFGVV